MKKTVLAIILNTVLPGTGYLYIGVKSRKPLAIFLIFITLYELVHTLGNLINGNYNLYAINLSPFFPGFSVTALGVITVIGMGLDVYFLMKRQDKRTSRSKLRTAKVT
jgi:hypothetical protein